jgi:hypothetical protein
MSSKPQGFEASTFQRGFRPPLFFVGRGERGGGGVGALLAAASIGKEHRPNSYEEVCIRGLRRFRCMGHLQPGHTECGIWRATGKPP